MYNYYLSLNKGQNTLRCELPVCALLAYLIFVLANDCFRKVLHLAGMLGQSPESREGAGPINYRREVSF